MIAKIEWSGIIGNLAAFMLISQGFLISGFILGGFACMALMYTSFKLNATKFIFLNAAFFIINMLGIFHNV